jgi:hypothetical protein
VRIYKPQAILLQHKYYVKRDLLIWTMYERPRDFPNSFICRPFSSKNGAEPLPEYMQADSLKELRAQLPDGLTCMQRHPNDDANIVETWL